MPLSTTIDIERPAADVFDYVTDPNKFAEWQDGVVSGHMDKDGPWAAGDTCVTTRKIGFLERRVRSQVTHSDPPRAWGVRGTDGPIRASVDVTVDPLEGNRSSRVTIGIDFRGLGFGRLLVPLVVVPQARREMPANMKRLKQCLESQR